MAFLEGHNILEVFKSSFQILHSTESALLRVFDIFLVTDCVMLVLFNCCIWHSEPWNLDLSFGVLSGLYWNSTGMVQDLRSLAQYMKPTITNLKVKMDSDFKLYSQIKAAVTSSFFQLRQMAKMKPVLPRQHFQTVIRVFLTTQLVSTNALYVGVSASYSLFSRWYKMSLHIV